MQKVTVALIISDCLSVSPASFSSFFNLHGTGIWISTEMFELILICSKLDINNKHFMYKYMCTYIYMLPQLVLIVEAVISVMYRVRPRNS